MAKRIARETELPSGTLLEVEEGDALVWTRFLGNRRLGRARLLSQLREEMAEVQRQRIVPMPPEPGKQPNLKWQPSRKRREPAILEPAALEELDDVL